MKSLSESIFSKDLVSQSVPVDPEVFWDLVQTQIYNKLHRECIDAGWIMNLNDDGLRIEKRYESMFTNSLGKSDLIDKVSVKLEFEKYYDHVCVPVITVINEFGGWYISFSDMRSAKRWIEKVHPNIIIDDDIKGGRGVFCFQFDSETVGDVIDLMKRIIKQTISPSIDRIIKKQVDQFSNRGKEIPGIVIDQAIMKKIIEGTK